MKPFEKFKQFQIRWKEGLGTPECYYAYRWVLITPWFCLRLHHFIRSDDSRYFHDHAWNFITFIIKGHYYDVSEKGSVLRKQFHFYKVPSTHAHYVDVPEGGCWTFVINGKVNRKWGFWVDGKFKRPLKYFHKFGHPPCSEQ